MAPGGLMSPYELGELELRHLLAVQAIAESGTFWAAAERLGCSQSALSQRIATVERILGTRLIERRRGRRNVTTTEAGRLLPQHPAALLPHPLAGHADFTALAQGRVRALGVAALQSNGQRLP